VQCAEIAARSNWSGLAAVRGNRIHEIPAEDILQPGFRLIYGYEHLKRLIAEKASAAIAHQSRLG
jgi:hypothetical protein